MANEITVSASLSFRKGGAMNGIDVAGLTVTMTGTNWLHHRQSIGFAAEEALVLGEAVAGGWIMLVNRDATNFVSMRRATGESNFLKLKAGECALFRMTATAPFLIADTAAVEVEYLIIED